LRWQAANHGCHCFDRASYWLQAAANRMLGRGGLGYNLRPVVRVRSNSVHDTFGTCPVRFTFRYTEDPILYTAFSVQCPFRYTFVIYGTLGF